MVHPVKKSLRNTAFLAALPLIVTASCVMPGAEEVRALRDATAGAEFDAPPPTSSLGRLAPEQEEQWAQAAGQFDAPSAAPALPFSHEGDEVSRSRALDCLATAIYYEARSESEEGQRAVAQVVLNRVRHPAFPSSVCGVVYQGAQRRTGCQFSFTCDGSMAQRPRGAAWGRAQRIAAAALSGDVYAPVGTATHYHTTAILPYWAPSLTRSAVIGAHVFYRWKGAQGRSSAFRQAYSGSEGGQVIRASEWRPEVEEDISAETGPVERIRVATGTVRIHRGGAASNDEAAAKPAVAESFGVRIHRGTTPEI